MIRDRAKFLVALAVVFLFACGGQPDSVDELDGGREATTTTRAVTTVAPGRRMPRQLRKA